jgi:hypothetical protein
MKTYPLSATSTLLLAAVFVVFWTPVTPSAAEQTWSGQISDSMCKAKHEEAAEGAGTMADRECTLSCVKGGSKFVLVADGKVYQITNQDDKDLTTHAGHKVKLSGELRGESITVSKIEMQ